MSHDNIPGQRLIDEMRKNTDMHDRKNSLLTQRDRKYLLGKEVTDSSNYERQINQQIRERIISGLLDFGIVANHLGDSQLEQIFDLRNGTLFNHEAFPEYYHFYHQNWGKRFRRDGGPVDINKGDFDHSFQLEKRVAVTVFEYILADMFGFVFRSGLESNIPLDFGELVEAGLTRALENTGRGAIVELDYYDLSLEQLMQKEEYHGLNREEFRIMYDLFRKQRESSEIESHAEGIYVCPACGNPKVNLEETEITFDNLFTGQKETYTGVHCECGWRGPEMDLRWLEKPRER